MGKVPMILLGYICLVYGHAVEAVPTSIPMWKSPCRTTDSTQTISPMSISLKDASDALKENAAHFTRVVSDMKANYTPPKGRRITGSSFIQMLESYDNIPGLDLPQEEHNITNVTGAFLEDYESFSRLAVFLEQVIDDEKTFEFEEYLRGMKSIENEISLILCNLHIAIHSAMNATISNFVEGDVMTDEWRSVRERTKRFMRDYIIFHKAENFGKVVEKKYRLLSREISN